MNIVSSLPLSLSIHMCLSLYLCCIYERSACIEQFKSNSTFNGCEKKINSNTESSPDCMTALNNFFKFKPPNIHKSEHSPLLGDFNAASIVMADSDWSNLFYWFALSTRPSGLSAIGYRRTKYEQKCARNCND